VRQFYITYENVLAILKEFLRTLLLTSVSRAKELLLYESAWPPFEVLHRFDASLLRWTSQFLLSKKWIPHYFILRNRRLYYSNGKCGHPDSHEGSYALMKSNPKLDGQYCIDLAGVLT
jgi:hypothetical protein